MDLDKALVSSLLAEGLPAIRLAREKGIAPEKLSGEGQEALRFVYTFVDQYGQVPTVEAVEGHTNIPLDPVSEPAAYWINTVNERALHAMLLKWGKEFAQNLESHKIVDAYESIGEIHRLARENALLKSKVESIPKLFRDVLEYYERIKSGERGILTPWPTLNEATLGFWPGELALFVARTGIGKTWATVLMAHHAWKIDGKKVLFATTEISKLRIAMRFASAHYQFAYEHLRKGMLSTFQEKVWREDLDSIMKMEGLNVVGGEFNFSLEGLEGAIEEAEPDLLIMDGAYLMKSAGTNRIERAANAFDDLKRLLLRQNIPGIVTTQFNREVKSNTPGSVKQESIALTDVAAWNADLIIGLVQTDDMKKDKRMIWKPLKMREGVTEEWETNWDLDAMVFTELPKAGAAKTGGGDADEFGSGADPSKADDAPF